MEGDSLTKREKRQLAKEEKRKERQKGELAKNLRNWVIGLLVVFGLLLGGYRTWKWIATPVDSADQQEVLSISSSDRVKGNPESEVVLVEYGDFQCPACAGYSGIVKRLAEDYGENIAVVYRHFPLVTIHSNAFNAAKTAEAAGMQGKFWEMHDLLYEKQDEWSGERNPNSKFFEYVETLELDKEKFEKDFDSSEVKEKVEKDLFGGQLLGVSGTPSFYLGGKKLNGIRDYDDFATKIDELLGN